MWKSLFLIFAVLLMHSAIAQTAILKAAGTAPDLFIAHTVAPKENYYSVGRLYNIPPKEIAAYNKLVFEKGLSLGQAIKIPLTTANFFQDGDLKQGEVTVPVYHTVQPKEGLYRISVNYNKVSMEALRKWNKLPSDVVSNGTNLIIGYLKVLADQSPLAKKATRIDKTMAVTPPAEKIPEPVKSNPVVVEKPKEDVAVKEPAKGDKNKDLENDKPYAGSDKPAIDFKGGAFKKNYKDNDPVKETGVTGIFKSTSGWQDGKYYCLHNTARPETIIKVTNPANGRIIYAKVLDMMPDLKQNNGSVILISNAAAEELGINDVRTEISLTYSQK